MRMVVATIAERTDLLNLVPLAWALRSAGHEVVVASQPELAGAVSAAGLPFAPVGRDHGFWRMMRAYSLLGVLEKDTPPFGMADAPEHEVTWDYLIEGYRRVVPHWWRMVNDSMADDLVDLCRTWKPDLVVWDPVTFCAPVAARAAGAAHVRYIWGVDTLARVRGLFLRRMEEQVPEVREDPLGEWLSGLAARYGVGFDEELVVGQATIDQVPDVLRIPVDGRLGVRYLGMRFVPYNGRAVVPDWLRRPAEGRRLCLTLGTSATDRFGGYTLPLGEVLEALGQVDAEVVATVPLKARQDLGTVPSNVRLVDYVPLHALAATSTATINHGGTGTVWTGLVHGLPQLFVPRPTFDEPMLARLIQGQGAGLVVEPDPDEILRASERVLTEPALAERATLLREQMLDRPTPAAMTAELERIAASPSR
ncbi:activator-dependent family glycosyltransferase [Nocardiopsis alba]|uniref:Activator-dependent family glycosyltransferase n=5 Tax=Nocardiopsis alba TaxID=53437 RepID=A0A7K2IRJ8_9ACTN|nr:activator-dependent family glycosyltransferase [Nocardiopsis alba]MYR32457.1 activator-dependent family glycosyltransferase [Nocardiopsis alba]